MSTTPLDVIYFLSIYCIVATDFNNTSRRFKMCTPRLLTEEQIDSLRGCSSFEQYYKMRKAFETDGCIFCYLPLDNKVIYNFMGWKAWIVPEKFTTRTDQLDTQLVFIPKRHVRHLNELRWWEWLGFILIIKWIYRTFKIPGGVIFARIGDMRYNVGTVPHLHFNLWVPNLRRDVWVPFCKVRNGDVWQKHDEQMRGYAKRYEASERP